MLLDSRPAADRGLSSAGDVLGGSGWTLSPGWRPLALSTACAPASRSSEHARAGNAFRWTTSKHGQPSAVLSSGLIGAGNEANYALPSPVGSLLISRTMTRVSCPPYR